MKVIVTVKQVPDTSGKVAVNPDGTLDRASMQTIINPDDMNAVEAALALKDELGCKVVAFTMGPPPAEGMLRELMAMGVDEGVLITAREFGGSDTYATSQIIAAGIDTYGVDEDDVILAGRQAIDGDTAQVGPQVAEDLDIPQVTYAWEVWPTEDGKSVRVKKELEDGFEILEMACPCAVTVTKPDYEPRFPTIKSKMAANKAKIPVLNAADCGLDVERSGLKGSPTKVKKSFTPPRKEGGLKIKEETPEESAKKLYDLLKDKGII